MNKFLYNSGIEISTFLISPIKITKEDKFWFSLINYHLTLPKIYGRSKTHKPGNRPIISGIGTALHLITSQNP